MKKFEISPSILSANFAKLGEEVQAVVKAGADRIHVDVMDQHFVPNLTIGPLVVDALRKDGISVPMDVHLMVDPSVVDQLIENFAKAGASSISIHCENHPHTDRSLRLIRSLNCEAGLVLNPATPLTALEQLAGQIDRVLLMSVNPGFGGQSFIPATLDKLREARKIIDDSGYAIRLEIDGGVTPDNIAEIAAAGADTFVAGSAIFNQPDYAQVIEKMRAALATV